MGAKEELNIKWPPRMSKETCSNFTKN